MAKNQNDGKAPWGFTMYGQNHHWIGSLLPLDDQFPAFCQLYMIDDENEIQHRKNALSRKKKKLGTNTTADTHADPQKEDIEYQSKTTTKLDDNVIAGSKEMLANHNWLCQKFRMWRDRYKENELGKVKLRLIGTRSRDARQYDLPTASEIAGLLVDDPESDGKRDIIISEKDGKLKNISELNPNYMPLQYPILFPYGEDSFHTNIPYNRQSNADKPDELGVQKKRQYVTMREYYAFRIQQRQNEGQTILRGGRLFQQFVVDAYATIEQSKLNWVRGNQEELRCDMYKGIREAVAAGDTEPGTAGRVILPSSFTGGPRYMIQHYQDAVAICRELGPPDLFITFTCNLKWNEITEALKFIDGQKLVDKPDIVSRVFHIKLKQLMSDLVGSRHFGEVKGALYTVEFQKWGLPHAHILLWLESKDKPRSAAHIDSIISAEIPDPDKEKIGYDAVCQFMIHGPCGDAKTDSPCMKNKKCSKKFPKRYCDKTCVDESRYPVYRRRKNAWGVEKDGIKLDNKWVVPYNLDLIIRYDAHINVEVCNCRGMTVKYLFKYLHKGNDRITGILQVIPAKKNNSGDNGDTDQIKNPKKDEIDIYLEGRYLSGAECTWRTLGFEIHYRRPTVERLPLHLEGEQLVIHKDTDNLKDVLDDADPDSSKFLQWMKANREHEDARELTYAEFPKEWIWDSNKREWRSRQRRWKIGRIYYVHPTAGEKYYLRILLNVQKGCRRYDDIKTMNGTTHPTFKAACLALGLLEHDGEWHAAIQEEATTYSGRRLRELFVILLLNCKVTEPKKLWDDNWHTLAEDIEYNNKKVYGDQAVHLGEEFLKNCTLREIEQIFW
ncbi:uncharacterized protein LOC113272351 [Papaver somniferum]|uniref:uncharacterized protein LOC113272351 n=1 Tax=Papaver somniferum TaxID=3469 RepID=UPI000E6F94A7|nr:uncharacterized protein LOC113272351 [Papaver somniferum]